ncbi:MAG: hypothetical protein AAF638_04070 [Pseudomonadota bacterium]
MTGSTSLIGRGRVCGVLVATLVAGGFLAQALAEPFQHSFGELREYHRHWLSVCPDTHTPGADDDYATTCWATTWTGNPDGSMDGFFPGDRLSVQRNRVTGALSITFVSVPVEEVDQDRPVEVRFSSGRIRAFAYGSAVTPNRNSGNEYTFTNPEDVADLIRCMRAGSHMTITLPTTGDDATMQFSLWGLRRAMGFLERYADQAGPAG